MYSSPCVCGMKEKNKNDPKHHYDDQSKTASMLYIPMALICPHVTETHTNRK
jgi:hypothetical protein